ncbi:putative vomeronasal receptor-like protein 4 [Thomomys bottae]
MALLRKCYVSQIGTALSANIFLFLSRVFIFLLHHRAQPTDVTICHLALVHILMLLCTVFLMFTDKLGKQIFQADFPCKMLVYLHRVMRNLSLCTTCLLSLLQAITISPSTSWLVKFKSPSSRYLFHCLFFLWFLNSSFSSNLVVYIVSSSNTSRLSHMIINEYCSFAPMNSRVRYCFLLLTFFRDSFSVGLMLFSSAHMVSILCRHQRRVQHLYSTSLSPRVSSEQRATQTILLLVSLFVISYCTDIIISSISSFFWTHSSVVKDIQKFVVPGYATGMVTGAQEQGASQLQWGTGISCLLLRPLLHGCVFL